ncbi:MAG: hypothetical protein ACI379_06145 [Nocardioides sp.]|uniref:hypothetical protein n=1 Tax=Nocardioides sp. TaxID=35761 RepID=UPI003F093A1D
MLKLIKRTILLLLVAVFAVCAYVVWAGLTDREVPGPIEDALGGGHEVVGTDSHFRDLKVTEDDGGNLDGTIVVENTTDTYQDVRLTVELFNGDQNVGTLRGNVKLKPGKASAVDLFSTDDYVRWSDAHVDLMRSVG